MAKQSPADFVREVRQELRKVTWPSPAETIYSTVMVVVMVALMASFFLAVVAVLSYAIKSILGLGGQVG